MPFYFHIIQGDITQIFDKTLRWFEIKQAEVLESNKPIFLKVTRYRTSWGNVLGLMCVDFKKTSDGVSITITYDLTHPGPVYIQKYSNLHNLLFIEEYFSFLGAPLMKIDLQRLYPRDLLVESLFASALLSIGMLSFCYLEIDGFLNFFPHIGSILFLGLSLIMGAFAYPYVINFIKTASRLLELY